MDGHRAPAGLGSPGHRTVERPVHLAGARPGLEPRPRPAGPAGELRPGQRDEGPRRGVEQHGAGRRELGQCGDRAVGVHHAAQAAQLARQPLRDGRAPSLDDGPAGAVPECREQEAEGRGQGGRERLHGVRRRAGQQGPGRIGVEAACRVLHRRRPHEREAGEGQRVPREAAHRAQDVGHDAVQPVHQGPHQVPVGRGVPAEVRGRLADVPVQRGGPPTAERMGEGHLGLAQHDPEAGQVERAEEGRGHQRRVHRRAHVVTEAVEGERLRAGPAPDGGLPLEDLHPEAGPGQGQRGGQAVGSRADHDGIGTAAWSDVTERRRHGPAEIPWTDSATWSGRRRPLARRPPGQ